MSSRIEEKSLKILIFADHLTSWNGGTDWLKSKLQAILLKKQHKFYLLLKTENKQRFKSFDEFRGKIEFVNYKDIKETLSIISPDVMLFADISMYKYGIPLVSYSYDCQHLYYPEFFSEQVIKARNKHFIYLSYYSDSIIVASKDAKNDLINYYFTYEKKIFNLPFSGTYNEEYFKDNSEFLKTYKLPEKFFLVSSQFWKHKSQLTVVKAVNILKEKNINVVFTGKMEDSRGNEHIKEINEYVKSNKLSNKCVFLGFIPKKDQIEIMKKAQALIQPSLYEGGPGAGGINEAIVLNKKIIVSNIKINKELPKSSMINYFKVNDEKDLAQKMFKVWKEKAPAVEKDKAHDLYEKRIRLVSNTIYEAIDNAILNKNKKIPRKINNNIEKSAIFYDFFEGRQNMINNIEANGTNNEVTTRIYLFDLIPLIKIKKKGHLQTIYLFNFIKLYTIKKRNQTTKISLLGMPFFKWKKQSRQ